MASSSDNGSDSDNAYNGKTRPFYTCIHFILSIDDFMMLVSAVEVLKVDCLVWKPKMPRKTSSLHTSYLKLYERTHVIKKHYRFICLASE